MIIEKFDFSAFFNTKNVTNNQRVREYGILLLCKPLHELMNPMLHTEYQV